MFSLKTKRQAEAQGPPSKEPSSERKEFKPFKPGEWLTIRQAFRASLEVIRNAPSEMGLAALAEVPDETLLPDLFAEAMNNNALPRAVSAVPSHGDKDVVVVFDGIVPPQVLRVRVERNDSGVATSVSLGINPKQLAAINAKGKNPAFTARLGEIPEPTRDIAAPQSPEYDILKGLLSYIPEAMRPDLRPGKPA